MYAVYACLSRYGDPRPGWQGPAAARRTSRLPTDFQPADADGIYFDFRLLDCIVLRRQVGRSSFFFGQIRPRFKENENEGLLSMITFWTFGTVAERAE